jgi:tryptophan 2,3-dioxygenase
MNSPARQRDFESGVITDLAGRQTYAGYLCLDTLLDAHRPVSGHHDEMLFIIQHHVSELWIKLAIHELRSAMRLIAADDMAQTLKRLARIKHIQKQMYDQWAVLATLTPTEYLQFRDALGTASGFQSHQYRTLEFLLGNKDPQMLAVFEHDPKLHDALAADLRAPSFYDEFMRYLARNGYAVPPECLERDWARPRQFSPELVEVFRGVYADPDANWRAYETAEELVDIEESFQQWRFRHMTTVQRIIGEKTGTGGSSGVGFLRKALDLTFFPELIAVRTELTA